MSEQDDYELIGRDLAALVIEGAAAVSWVKQVCVLVDVNPSRLPEWVQRYRTEQAAALLARERAAARTKRSIEASQDGAAGLTRSALDVLEDAKRNHVPRKALGKP